MFKVGEFAKLEGQVVEILELKFAAPAYNLSKIDVKIRLTTSKLTAWVRANDLSPISSQKTPKILYSKNK